MHLKRQKAPKNWPVQRKGTAYLVTPSSNLKNGVPLLILLRDLLGVTKTRKEVKRAIHEKKILVNNKHVIDEKKGVLLFDIISLIDEKKSKRYYKVVLNNNGKFSVEEIEKEGANNKVSKVIGKKILKKKKAQINLIDGNNFLSNIKCNINDSVLISFEGKAKIQKCLPIKEKSNIIVFAGKHSGKKGSISKLDLSNKMAEVEVKGKKINVLIKQIMVLDE